MDWLVKNLFTYDGYHSLVFSLVFALNECYSVSAVRRYSHSHRCPSAADTMSISTFIFLRHAFHRHLHSRTHQRENVDFMPGLGIKSHQSMPV